VDIEDVAREVARRVLALGADHGFDLAGYWRQYLRESGGRRADVVELICRAYPSQVAATILESTDRPPRRLDGWPLPQALKDQIRGWRSRWRRSRRGWLA
jgi:hypothetical protein